MTLFKQTTAFDLSLFRPGHLIVLRNAEGVFASGIISGVLPLEIKAIIYTIGSRDYIGDINDLLEQVSPYVVDIERVISGEITLTVINPVTFEVLSS